MLDLFWQRLLPYQMTRIQEPDLLIDHDSGGGGGCKRFLGRPMVEPFAYSGIGHGPGSDSQKLNSGAGKSWFPFSSSVSTRGSMIPPSSSPYSYRTSSTSCSKGDLISTSSSSSTEENPIIVVHNNNNSLDILDENTRWSSSSSSAAPPKTSHFPSCNNKNSALPPLPPIVLLPHHTASSGESGVIKSSVIRNSKVKTKSKSKNNIKNSNDSNNKNNCNNGNNSSTSNINKLSGAAAPCINNCGPGSGPATTPSPCLTSTNHPHPPHPNCGGDDEDPSRQHLIIRYIHCNERPNKKQLVTLGLISVVFLIVLVILLALFLSPSSTRNLVSSSSNVKDSSSSDAFISSDITSNLNIDEGDLDDSDSYEDDRGETQFYSSSTSSSNISPGLDMKKVSKLSWDLLNSNQDASSRGSGGSIGGGVGGGLSSSPLGVSSNGEGEIILPAKMIYTSSGDSSDLMPAQPGTATGDGGPQNKKRSCCRTQKYSQVIKREGCEPLTIVNKMCFGQCVSVWVPGLFASFPVCRPSKSTFKTVTLTCGRNREKRKRVRIEKVRRCSCMEIEPTAASL